MKPRPPLPGTGRAITKVGSWPSWPHTVLCWLGIHAWFYQADGAPDRPYRFCQLCNRPSGNPGGGRYLDGTRRNHFG